MYHLKPKLKTFAYLKLNPVDLVMVFFIFLFKSAKDSRLRQKIINFFLFHEYSRRGASYSVIDYSVLSNPADAQNVLCLGLCGRDICPKSSA